MCTGEQQEGKKLSVVEGLSNVVDLAANFQKSRSKVVLTQGRRTKIVVLIVKKENNNCLGKMFCGVFRYRPKTTNNNSQAG